MKEVFVFRLKQLVRIGTTCVTLLILAACTQLYNPPPIPGFTRVDSGGDYRYMDPVWSPDSTKIAYWRQQGICPECRVASSGEVFVSDLSNGTIKQLTDNNLDDSNPSWSPDALRLVYLREYWSYNEQTQENLLTGTLRIVNIDGSSDKEIYACSSACNSPAWSPDGKQIAFSAFAAQPLPSFSIKIIDANSGSLLYATDPIEGASNLRWSPNGSQIAFEVDGPKQFEILDVKSGKTKLYGVQEASSPFWFAWSPDQHSLVFTGYSKSESQDKVYRLDLDTGLTSLFFDKNVKLPEFPQYLDLTRDGKKMLLTDGDVFIYIADLSKLRTP